MNLAQTSDSEDNIRKDLADLRAQQEKSSPKHLSCHLLDIHPSPFVPGTTPQNSACKCIIFRKQVSFSVQKAFFRDLGEKST